ncbi:MAG: polysaccharide deacetylase family protein [Firmicutes bacterium]|nr:polysaccharide deacetylase family protein [Bacillota bacterium]
MLVLILRRRIMFMVGGSILILLFWSWSAAYLPVYKNRQLWEKTGDIVWEGSTTSKQIAITFDDGPSATFTEPILELLKEYNARATFFVIGKRVELFPEIVRRQYREGHEIGNHTYEHREVNRLSEQELMAELRRAHQAIKRVIKDDVRVFRPTSGYYDEKIVKAAKELNYSVIIWTWGQDTRDWTYIRGWKIAQKVVKTVKPGDIILFHDQGGDRTNTIEALRIILPALAKRGYRFVTVSELLKSGEKPVGEGSAM